MTAKCNTTQSSPKDITSALLMLGKEKAKFTVQRSMGAVIKIYASTSLQKVTAKARKGICASP